MKAREGRSYSFSRPDSVFRVRFCSSIWSALILARGSSIEVNTIPIISTSSLPRLRGLSGSNFLRARAIIQPDPTNAISAAPSTTSQTSNMPALPFAHSTCVYLGT
ncbi:MAG TPA: hypothetical protein VL094_04575 [Sphingomonadaceae bacterium]|nr:hypothetical protein [Sphingomonadaceae bacterium]